MQDILLISPNTVKKRGDITLNYDDMFLSSSIRTAQDIFLVDFLGKDLVDRLKELVEAKLNNEEDNIDSENNIAYKTLLDEYVKEVLVYQVLIETAIRTSLKIRNLGVVKNKDTNADAADLKEIQYLLDNFRTSVNHWQNRTVDFLCENKEAIIENKFDCGCKPKIKFANTGLLLS